MPRFIGVEAMEMDHEIIILIIIGTFKWGNMGKCGVSCMRPNEERRLKSICTRSHTQLRR